MNILRELRFVATEVGLVEARRMPTEVRHWWIGEIQRDHKEREDATAGRHTRTAK